MEIKEIKKFNIQDGDIICLPDMNYQSVMFLDRQLVKAFPSKRFMIIFGKENQVKGIKVLHIKENKEKK